MSTKLTTQQIKNLKFFNTIPFEVTYTKKQFFKEFPTLEVWLDDEDMIEEEGWAELETQVWDAITEWFEANPNGKIGQICTGYGLSDYFGMPNKRQTEMEFICRSNNYGEWFFTTDFS